MNIKRIAILTFHNTINYGATLQAYALQQYLKNEYGNATIVNYENDPLTHNHSKQNHYQRRNLKQWILFILFSNETNKKVNFFKIFRSKYFTESDITYKKSSIVQSNDSFDIFIVGSDQVWNDDITHNDTTYLLDFVKKGKVLASYAASFGKEKIPSVLQETYKNLLARFSLISVREQQGAEIVQSLIDTSVEVVLDPIFLLSKTDWERITVPPQFISRKYIILYIFGRPARLFKLARTIAKETGYKIVVIGSDYRKQIGFSYTGSLGPEQFVGYLLNASYVLTNSFHGTAFSINFNKQFFVEMLPNGSKVNSRLINIINLLDLNDRQLSDGDLPDFRKSIDYDKVNKKLNIEKVKSYAFLEKIITHHKENSFGTN